MPRNWPGCAQLLDHQLLHAARHDRRELANRLQRKP